MYIKAQCYQNNKNILGALFLKQAYVIVLRACFIHFSNVNKTCAQYIE